MKKHNILWTNMIEAICMLNPVIRAINHLVCLLDWISWLWSHNKLRVTLKLSAVIESKTRFTGGETLPQLRWEFIEERFNEKKRKHPIDQEKSKIQEKNKKQDLEHAIDEERKQVLRSYFFSFINSHLCFSPHQPSSELSVHSNPSCTLTPIFKEFPDGLSP